MSVSVNDKNIGHVTAYAYAKAKGYTGTEEEFAELMAAYATVGQDAAQSAADAAQSASDAAGSAADAETAKTAAQTAKTGAETAQTGAQAAKTAAETAQGKAETAQTGAQAAQTAAEASKTQAAGSATAAATSATNAGNSATAAAGSATAAATAKTGAETAQAAAETAKTSAETAAASVSASAAQIETNKQDISDLKEDMSQETGENLFNVAEAVDGYLTTNGGITVYDDWKTTGYIPVYGLSSICASSKASASGVYNYNPLYFLHSYDAEKNHIRKEKDSTTNGVFSIPSGVHYIRFSYHNYDFGVDLMVVSGKKFALYRPYEVFNKLTASAYDDQHQLVADKVKKNIVCFGDSLTYSQYSTNITYPNKLHELINEDNTVINLGIPGEKTMAIASRQGAMTVKAIPPFTLLATDVSNVQIRDVNGDPFTTLLHNSSRPYQVKSPANAVLDGQSVNLAYSNGNYIISQIGSGNEVKTFTRPAEITMVGSHYRNYMPIIWAGTNDAPTTEEDAVNIARLIRAMVNYSNREEYLVLGLTVKAYADVANKILAYEFGRHYVDVKSYLINYGLDDNNITPTSQDETDIANEVVPASLRYDSVHFNDYGYTAVANCVYNHGKDLGYWS